MALLMELKSTKGEVDRLEAKLKSANDRVVELWQENSEQLLRYDGILAQKEQQLQQVKKILESRELKLARLKASFLTEAAILGFCKDSRLLLPTDGHVGEVLPNPVVKESASMYYSLGSSRTGLASSGGVVVGLFLPTSTSWLQGPQQHQGSHGITTTTWVTPFLIR